MRHTEHWTDVSTLLGLISSAYLDLYHWRSKQQPQNAETETPPLSHQSMPHISDAKTTSHRKNARPHDLMCLESTFFRTEDIATSRATASQSALCICIHFNLIYIYIYIYIYICVCVCVLAMLLFYDSFEHYFYSARFSFIYEYTLHKCLLVKLILAYNY